MALSEDETTLKRQAFCDGAFAPSSQPGNPAQRNISPELMAELDAMSDEDVRVVLRAYQANKAAALLQASNSLIKQMQALQTKITALNAIIVAPVPVPQV